MKKAVMAVMLVSMLVLSGCLCGKCGRKQGCMKCPAGQCKCAQAAAAEKVCPKCNSPVDQCKCPKM